MYEHPVFCLASQVMDLTIREYLHHPLPTHPPTLSSSSAFFSSALSPPSPPYLCFLLRDVAAAMLVFYPCLLSVRVSGECAS